MSNTVERLQVVAGADLSGFRKGMRQMRQGLKDAGDSVNRNSERMKEWGATLSATVTTSIAAAAAGLTALTKRTADYASQLKLAEAQSGMTAERIQEIAYAAKQTSGVDFDAVRDGLKELALRSAEAAEGTGEAKEAFARLGISQQALQQSSPAALFEKVQSRMKGLTQAQRILTAEQVFGGEAGEKFAEVMNLSAKEMQKLKDEARASGAVLSGEQVAALDKTSRGFEQLMSAVSGAGSQLAASLAPLLNDVVLPALLGVAQALGRLAEWFGSLPRGVKVAAAAVAGLAAAAGPLLYVLGSLPAIMATVTGVMGTLSAGFGTLGTAAAAAWAAITSPVGLVIAAVSAVAGAAYLIYRNWQGVSAFFSDLWESVTQVVRGAKEVMLGYLQGLWPRVKKSFLKGISALVGPVRRLARLLGMDSFADSISGFQAGLEGMVPTDALAEANARIASGVADMAAGVSAGAGQIYAAGEGLVTAAGDVAGRVRDQFADMFSFDVGAGGGAGGVFGGGAAAPTSGGGQGSGQKSLGIGGLKQMEGLGPQVEGGLLGKIKKTAREAPVVLQKAKEKMSAASRQIADTVTRGFADAATGMLEGIGRMAAGQQTLGGVVRSVLSTLASLAIRVGKIAIATGIAVEGIRDALASLNPAVAIAAGAALIAVGSAAKASLSAAAGGGGSGGGGGGGSRFYSRSSARRTGAGSSGGGGTLEARVEGSDLLFTLREAERKENR